MLSRRERHYHGEQVSTTRISHCHSHARSIGEPLFTGAVLLAIWIVARFIKASPHWMASATDRLAPENPSALRLRGDLSGMAN